METIGFSLERKQVSDIVNQIKKGYENQTVISNVTLDVQKDANSFIVKLINKDNGKELELLRALRLSSKVNRYCVRAAKGFINKC